MLHYVIAKAETPADPRRAIPAPPRSRELHPRLAARVAPRSNQAVLSRLKRRGVGSRQPGAVPPIVQAVLRAPGRPLEPHVRAEVESRFAGVLAPAAGIPAGGWDRRTPQRVSAPGDLQEQEAERVAGAALRAPAAIGLAPDFGGVRIYTGPAASASARAVQARAYTVGTAIVFDAGEYAPATPAGRQLLAHELAHVAQQAQAPLGTVARQLAAMLDYNQLADQIHRAVAGLGTDEEAVYLALERLQRDPAAITNLETAYLTRYHVSLEADIRDDFSGTELEYALQLLNRGRVGSLQAVGPAPATVPEFQAAARRLRNAVEGWGTDEEAIFAVLAPFRRSTGRIAQLKAVYFALYGEDLRARIVDEMSGSELDNALYLLGERTWEITEVSLPEARRLFAALSNAKFLTDTGAQAPIPFHYPPDGCYARAHLMAELLTATGYASEKVFAVSTYAEGLRVATPYAADVPVGQTPSVTWWYHVAPILRVRNAAGGVDEMVIDPSTATGPIPINQWTGMMSGGSFTRMTVPQIEQHLLANPHYAPSQRLVFTTPRTVFGPTGPFRPPTSAAAEAEMEAVRPRISGYAGLQPLHEIAAVIRGQLSRATIDVNAIVTAISGVSAPTRNFLWAVFPNLRTELALRLAPAQMALVNAAVAAP